jgi:Family of unknown function (DUF5330)
VWDYILDADMGLIRKIIVLGGALMAMPSPPPSLQSSAVAQVGYSSASWAYISAAADTVADVKGFCERKPQVCSTAQYLAGNVEAKAKYSARLIYEWANESTTGKSAVQLPQNIAASDPVKTGSIDVKVASTSAGNTTLRIEDLIPEWRGSIDLDKG